MTEFDARENFWRILKSKPEIPDDERMALLRRALAAPPITNIHAHARKLAKQLVPCVLLAILLPACSEGTAAFAEKRRSMNDAQARATMAAVCDISVGAHLRMSSIEQEAALVLCDPARSVERLRASERP